MSNINKLQTANSGEIEQYQALFTQIATDIKTTQDNIMRLQQMQEDQLQKIQNTTNTQQQLKQLSQQIDDTLLTFTQILLNHFSYIIINQDTNALAQLYKQIRNIRIPPTPNTTNTTQPPVLNQLIEALIANTKILKNTIKNTNQNGNRNSNKNKMLPMTILNKATENSVIKTQQDHLKQLLSTLQSIVKIALSPVSKASNTNFIQQELQSLQTYYQSEYEKLQTLEGTIDANRNMSNNLFNAEYMASNLSKVASVVLAILKQYYLLGSVLLKTQKYQQLL